MNLKNLSFTFSTIQNNVKANFFFQQQLQGIYGRQNSEPNARPNMSNLATEAMYARQLSTGPPTSQPPQGLYGQLTKPQPQPPQQLLQPPQPPQVIY
jgi:hypothetical protein